MKRGQRQVQCALCERQGNFTWSQYFFL